MAQHCEIALGHLSISITIAIAIEKSCLFYIISLMDLRIKNIEIFSIGQNSPFAKMLYTSTPNANAKKKTYTNGVPSSRTPIKP
jgi:hypothetical protein